MKKAYIISSTKNLDQEFEHLHWLRLFFLSNDYSITEDWINHSLNVHDNKPRFKQAPNFDYLAVATKSIKESDKLVFLLSSDSGFVKTLLRYALHQNKEVIIICKNKTVLNGLPGNYTVFNFGDYQKKIKEFM